MAQALGRHVLDRNLGLVFGPNLGVRLSSAPERTCLPDIVVLLNHSLAKLTEFGVQGAPDIVVEVLSPSTQGYDQSVKRDLYAQAGVPEYWLVDPNERSVEILVLDRDGYRSLGPTRCPHRLESTVLPDFDVPVEQVLAQYGLV